MELGGHGAFDLAFDPTQAGPRVSEDIRLHTSDDVLTCVVATPHMHITSNVNAEDLVVPAAVLT